MFEALAFKALRHGALLYENVLFSALLLKRGGKEVKEKFVLYERCLPRQAEVAEAECIVLCFEFRAIAS